jgi:hypothetical protein
MLRMTVCIFALLPTMQIASFPRIILLLSVACPAGSYCYLWPVRPVRIVICGLSGRSLLLSVACPAGSYCYLWPVRPVRIVICGLSGRSVLLSVACPAGPYCYLWPVRPIRIFPQYLINGAISRKKCVEHKSCVSVLYNFCLKHFYSKKKLARYYQKCAQGCIYSVHYYCQILMQLESARQVFEKFASIKFYLKKKRSSNGSRVVPCVQMDGRTDNDT